MDYKVLYRKYRPNDFDSIVGQNHIVKLLKNSISEDKISHAYIFTGPRGTGKTSTAKIFAKAINCTNNKDGNPCNKCDMCININENPDIIEIDAASNNGVDDIRELIDNVRLSSSISKYKVYIIDEFHMLSTSAFNALLLTLEEPPKNVVFILATTDIQSVPITILSRCQRFDFKLISNDDIVDRLKYVCKKEKINITDEALKEIAILSNGGLRDALSILDQISSTEEKIDEKKVISNFGTISDKKIKEFIDLMDKKNINDILNTIRKFKNDGVNYKLLISKLIDGFKQVLIDLRLDKCKYNFKFENIYNMIFELNSSLSTSNNVIDSFSILEVVIIKYIDISDNNKVIINNSNDIKDDISIEKNESDSLVENDNTNNDIKNNIKFNIDIRINNTFANAKKNYLVNLKEKWNDFIIYESNANKKLMSYILDTEIVVASDCYAILTNKLESTVDLINENIKLLEQDLKNFYGNVYKLVCLSLDDWNECKEKYIFNTKNNIKYSIINEAEEESNNIIDDDESNDELEKLAAEIFEDNVDIR